jgi:hypothetical protein
MLYPVSICPFPISLSLHSAYLIHSVMFTCLLAGPLIRGRIFLAAAAMFSSVQIRILPMSCESGIEDIAYELRIRPICIEDIAYLYRGYCKSGYCRFVSRILPMSCESGQHLQICRCWHVPGICFSFYSETPQSLPWIHGYIYIYTWIYIYGYIYIYIYGYQVPDTRSARSCQVPDRARYQIVPGTWSCQVPDRARYLIWIRRQIHDAAFDQIHPPRHREHAIPVFYRFCQILETIRIWYVNIRTDPFATLVPKLPKSGYIFWRLYPMSIFGSIHLQHWY